MALMTVLSCHLVTHIFVLKLLETAKYRLVLTKPHSHQGFNMFESCLVENGLTLLSL